MGEDALALGDPGLLPGAVLEGRQVLGGDILLGVGVGIEGGDHKGDQGDEDDDEQGDHGDVVVAQTAHGILHEGHRFPHGDLLGLFLIRGGLKELRVDLQAQGILEVFLIV